MGAVADYYLSHSNDDLPESKCMLKKKKKRKGLVNRVVKNPPDSYIPDELLELGIESEANPPPFEMCRMVLMSMFKEGKTTLIGGGEQELILDFGNGSHSIKGQKCLRFVIKSYEDFQKKFATIIDLARDGKLVGKTGKPITRVWFDTGGETIEVIFRQIIKEWNEEMKSDDSPEARVIGQVGYKGTGYGLGRDRLKVFRQMLEEVGLVMSITCHLTDKEVTIGGESVIVPKVNIPPSFEDDLLCTPEIFLRILSIEEEIDTFIEKEVVKAGKKVIKKFNNGSKRVRRYYADFDPPEGAKYGGCRVPLKGRHRLKTIKDGEPNTNWDLIRDLYEAARAKLIKRINQGE